MNSNGVQQTVWTLTSTQQTVPFRLINHTGYSVQITWTGTPTGTWTLQGSNDPTESGASVSSTSWSTITGSSLAAGGAASDNMWISGVGYYRWLRVVYTFTGSTGTATINICGKSAGG